MAYCRMRKGESPKGRTWAVWGDAGEYDILPRSSNSKFSERLSSQIPTAQQINSRRNFEEGPKAADEAGDQLGFDYEAQAKKAFLAWTCCRRAALQNGRSFSGPLLENAASGNRGRMSGNDKRDTEPRVR